MPNPAHKGLEETLGRVPSGLNTLSEAQQQKLLSIIFAAHKAHQAEYSVAFEKSLKHVPALLRGTVRKIITG
jgi:hypothetical protein